MSKETKRELIKKLDKMKAICAVRAEVLKAHEDARFLFMERLSPEEREVLRKLASGEISAESKLRGRAINILGFERKDPDEALSVLQNIILSETNVQLRIKSLRAMARINRDIAIQLSRELLRVPDTNTALSLAAARISILDRKVEVTQELDDLRNRFVKFGIHDNSQTMRTLKSLIKMGVGVRD